MSKRLYDERIEVHSQDEIRYMDEIMAARRETVSPIVRMHRLRLYRRELKIDQFYADKDFKNIYDVRIRAIDLLIEGLDFALKLDIVQCLL